ncbi:MAG: hypothetical protein HQK53_13755, partial [Oligoflexia bacterium]|nr:hypothetical protein [Oligoflexia bacterium]
NNPQTNNYINSKESVSTAPAIQAAAISAAATPTAAPAATEKTTTINTEKKSEQIGQAKKNPSKSEKSWWDLLF